MKVYTVCQEENNEVCKLVGIFSTNELAQAFIDEVKKSDRVPLINSKADEVELDSLNKFMCLMKEGYKQYYYQMFKDGSYKIEEEKLYHFINSKFHLNNAHVAKKLGMESSVWLYGIVWALSPEKAIELIDKKRLEMINSGEW
jgi:hypothetical protein